jgi:transposase
MPMTSKQRSYTEEFRKNAVSLSHSSQKSLVEIAGELGLGFSTLTRWRKKYSEMGAEIRKPRVASQNSTEQIELIKLKRDNERLKKEVEILKKATALFVKDLS